MSTKRDYKHLVNKKIRDITPAVEVLLFMVVLYFILVILFSAGEALLYQLDYLPRR